MIEIDPPRLLVIDDDTIHRMVISRVGDEAGYVVTCAASCVQAVELSRQSFFECITLDLSLGRDKGTDVMDVLSGIHCRSAIVIISSADSDKRHEDVRYAEQCGLTIRCELPKLLDITKLREVLEEIATGVSASHAVHSRYSTPEKSLSPATRAPKMGLKFTGIAKSDLSNLFQNFGQANRTISTKYGGTRLGLALSQKLCGLMGGGITATSEAGRGSYFTIRVLAWMNEETNSNESIPPLDAPEFAMAI